MLSIICLIVGVILTQTTEGQISPLRIITSDIQAAFLDPISGVISTPVSLTLPDAPPDCKWVLPLVGTRGQTSAIFHLNQTNFFTGQLICPEGVQKTTIFQIYGPYSPSQGARVYTLYQIDPAIPLIDINMNWDHTCNVVVLQPESYPNGTLITTKQVSEYDTAVRPQANFEFDGKDCVDCWRKIPGLSALDFGSFGGISNPELNCGDSCIFYVLEEHLVNGEVIPPRSIIGRSFRTGGFAFNITDSVQAQTLSWSPLFLLPTRVNQFLGIGICCVDKWCHPDCQNLDSHMVLFSFLPYNTGQEISILADIGDVIDPDTVRIGVEYTPIFTSTNQQAYVYYQQTVISFDLVVENYSIVGAKKSHQSPKVDGELVVWSSGYGFYRTMNQIGLF